MRELALIQELVVEVVKQRSLRISVLASIRRDVIYLLFSITIAVALIGFLLLDVDHAHAEAAANY